MQFKEVIGQEKLKENLIRIVKDNRLSHALLFQGSNGYGTLGLAIALSQYIFCEDRSAIDSCGNCPSCLKTQKLIHPDLHFSFPVNSADGSSGKVGSDDFISQWRTIIGESSYFDLKQWNERIGIEKKQSLIKVEESKAIMKKLSLKSFEAKHKILIIWSAEKMNGEAANRLLKLIEEPAEDTLIILLSENTEQIIQTIRSRTQVINVLPIREAEIEKAMIKTFETSPEQAIQVARQAEGDLIRAERLLHRQHEEEAFFTLFTEWMRACYEANVERIYKWVEEISSASYGRERQKRFLIYVLDQMREGILRNYSGTDLQHYFGKEGQFMDKFSPFIIAENILEINELINEAHYHIERNAYAKIVFMDMSMQFANLLRAKNRKFASKA